MSTRDATVVAYDFRRPNKFNRDHVRALEIVGETFARQFTTVLSTSLRAVSQVHLTGVSQLTYDEFVRETPNPTFLAVLGLDPLPGTSLLHIPLDVVMAMIDRLLGGDADGDMPERPLTEIETRLVRSLLDRTLRELVYAFEPLTPVDPRVVQFESNPQFAQITAATDMVITLDFDLKVGGHGGAASLCMPFASLQPVLDEVSASSMHPMSGTVDPAIARAAMSTALDQTSVEVSVRFRDTRLTTGEIVDLRPGDILPLAHHVDVPLNVAVAGVSCYQGRAGQRARRLACLLVDPTDGADAGANPVATALAALGITDPETTR